ncbi:MAG TPA: hypothetical protein VD931_05075 [Baekduia sp.]|nr:hypothetical protein [Baekduia sp.]
MTGTAQPIGRRDVAIAFLLSALGVALMISNVNELNAGTRGPDQEAAVHIGSLLPFEAAIPLFLLVTVPLVWRRTAPLQAGAASLGGLALNVALVGSEFLRCGIVLPTAMLFAFAAASMRDGRDARLGLGLGVALAVGDFLLEFGPAMGVAAGVLTAAVWGIGRVVRSRGRLADELLARTAELRDARDERARLEVATDRARLSRELDDLLQRRLGELARLADEGARPQDAATATATLVDIEHESRRTLEEMRAVVGVLRDQDHEAPSGPQPTLVHLEALLVQAKGGDARLTVEGSPRVLPAAVELSAYRVVEHLLAAIDDAPDVEVRVTFADDALELAVSGPARRRAKAAIERARERARLQRGTLETRLHGGRADTVVSLPLAVVS